MKTNIWYSVQNGGDGSAYPEFMESKELCEIDQRYMEEGWGEECIGCLTIESSSPLKVKDIVTIKDVIKEVKEELNQDYMKQYKKEGKHPGWFKRLEEKLEALIQLK